MVEPRKRPATYADLEAVPPHLVAEIIDGELVTRPVGVPVQAMARTALSSALSSRSTDYLILSNVELRLGGQVVVPELGRWNRSDLVPRADDAWLDIVPDWVCTLRADRTRDEIICERRRAIYAEWGVAHLWCIDVQARRLETLELRQGSWRSVQNFDIRDTVSAAPFKDIAFPLAVIWPLDLSIKSERVH